MLELNEWVKQNEKGLNQIIVSSIWKMRKGGWRNKINIEDLKQSLWLKVFQSYSKYKVTNLSYYTKVCQNEILDHCSKVWEEENNIDRHARIDDNLVLTDSNFKFICSEQNYEPTNCSLLTILDFLEKNDSEKENEIISALLRRYEGFEEKFYSPNKETPFIEKEFARVIAVEAGYASNNNNYYRTKYKALFKLKKFMEEIA